MTPHFIAKLSYKGEVFRTQLEGLGWIYKDGVYRKIVNGDTYTLMVLDYKNNIELELYVEK